MQSPKNDNPIKTSPISVLIVDDDEPTRALLKPAIQKWGYDILEARDGESAWKRVHETNPPQILIIDWMMPHLSGVELCQRIRKKLYPNYNPYIILLTQSSGTENIVTGLEAGANEFLTKPINLAELKSRIAVGVKVINYEAMLTEQNIQLKNYIATIEAASTLAKNASESLSNVMKEKKAAHFQQLEKVDSHLNEILEIFNEFKSEEKRRL